MDALLLVFAWAAGLLSLFLVGDMIAADFATRRAERRLARLDHTLEYHRRSGAPR
jgi:hypothetical protein